MKAILAALMLVAGTGVAQVQPPAQVPGATGSGAALG